MMDKVFFIVYGDPKGKARPRVTRGHAYTPKNTAEYENKVLLSYRKSYPDRIPWEHGVPLKARIRAYYAIPETITNKKKELMRKGEAFPTKKPDADNVEKIILDSLEKILFHNDAQFVDCRTTKHYGDVPRVEIEISEVKT